MTGFENVIEQNKSFIVMISPAVQIAQIESSKEYMKEITHFNNLFWIQVKKMRIACNETNWLVQFNSIGNNKINKELDFYVWKHLYFGVVSRSRYPTQHISHTVTNEQYEKPII